MLPGTKTGWPTSRYAAGISGEPAGNARVAPLRWTQTSRPWWSSIFATLCATSYTWRVPAATAAPRILATAPRTRCAMAWRFANAKFAAAAIAARYRRPSGEESGAQASWRSGRTMPSRRIAASIVRT